MKKNRRNGWSYVLFLLLLSPYAAIINECAAYQISMSFVTGSDNRQNQIRKNLNMPSREPAGVENLFSLIINERRTGENDIKNIRLPVFKIIKTAKNAIAERKSRRNGSSRDKIQLFDVWKLGEMRASLVDSWACESVEEEERLSAMKLLLHDSFQNLRQEFQAREQMSLNPSAQQEMDPVASYPDVYGDLRLLRFLRKYKIQDPVSASLQYKQFLQWRKEHDVDRIRDRVENAPFDAPDQSNVADYFPCDFRTGKLISGELSALLMVGSWDTNGITKAIKSGRLTLTEFLEYWIYIYESIHYQLHNQSLKKRRLVFLDEICDLSGMHASQLSPSFISEVLKPWLKLTQTNYPETTKHIVFFNPPRILKLAWTIVTPMVSEGTVEKVKFCREYKGSSRRFIEAAKINELVSTI